MRPGHPRATIRNTIRVWVTCHGPAGTAKTLDPARSSPFRELADSATLEFSLHGAWVFNWQPSLAGQKRKVSRRNSAHIITLTATPRIQLPHSKPLAAPEKYSPLPQTIKPCLLFSEALLPSASSLWPE